MKSLMRCIIVCAAVMVFPLQCQNSHDSVVQNALQKFYDTYKRTGYLSGAHLAKLNINFARIAQSTDDGYATLQLIEWLEKQQDDQSKIVLSAINELCYGEFVRILSALKEHELVIEKFQYLADKEVVTDGITYQPFRTSLSKMLLMIALIKSQKLNNVRQKEVLALSLSKIKNEMLKINKSLGEDKVHEGEIREVCAVLQVYALPVIVPQPSSISKKFIVITVMLIIIVTITIYYAPALKVKMLGYLEFARAKLDLQRAVLAFTQAYETFATECTRITASCMSYPLRRAIFAWGAENMMPQASAAQGGGRGGVSQRPGALQNMVLPPAYLLSGGVGGAAADFGQ